MEKIRKYSKAIAALVSVLVGVAATQWIGIDSIALEASIITALTAVGVIVAPANK